MSAGVGPRVPKDDFMRALGLEPSDARHEGFYRAMRVSSQLPLREGFMLKKNRMRQLTHTRNLMPIGVALSKRSRTIQLFDHHSSGIISVAKDNNGLC